MVFLRARVRERHVIDNFDYCRLWGPTFVTCTQRRIVERFEVGLLVFVWFVYSLIVMENSAVDRVAVV